MEAFAPGTTEYEALKAIKDEMLNGKTLPQYIFCERDWILTFITDCYVFGQQHGVFHERIAAFLKAKRQQHYYLMSPQVVRVTTTETHFKAKDIAWYKWWEKRRLFKR